MELQVVERRLGEAESCDLESGQRVVYNVADNTAEYSAGALKLAGPIHVLCFELVASASPEAKLSAPVELNDDEARLIRCDRVDFPPGGCAYLHVHQGPGIRVLLQGTIRIDTDGTSHSYAPLEAWFESGPVPVFAAASETEPTAFVRCMVLPGELKGKSSIRYVRPEDADKPKSQSYQVFVDEPLADLSVSA
jgi:quercetin dioxygenase-like cupin family protein